MLQLVVKVKKLKQAHLAVKDMITWAACKDSPLFETPRRTQHTRHLIMGTNVADTTKRNSGRKSLDETFLHIYILQVINGYSIRHPPSFFIVLFISFLHDFPRQHSDLFHRNPWLLLKGDNAHQ